MPHEKHGQPPIGKLNHGSGPPHADRIDPHLSPRAAAVRETQDDLTLSWKSDFAAARERQHGLHATHRTGDQDIRLRPPLRERFQSSALNLE